MKYVVILGDGMADYPSKTLGGRTPLEIADKPNIDDLCKRGKLGLVKTVPDGMKPGSDVANLSMMGYAPDKYYTGRSPLEALSIGIDLKDTDVAIRCNLVTLSEEEENYADKTMVDYSAGEISTEEAKELIEYLQQNLGDEYIDFYAGVSYRHCLVAHNAELGTEFTPPHDISDKKITEYLPKGEYGDIFLDIMTESYTLLKDHPINKKRVENGLRPANSIWLWGEGTRPALTPFEEKYGIKGAVISAVDLIKGIGIGAKMKVIEVEGATGTYKTNFKGKAKACIDALKEGYDYVYIHMEAPDECGHQGDAENKVKSIELIDSIVVKYVKEQLDKMDEDYKILIAPDHPTPLSLKTHTSDPVPFIIYSHKAGEKDAPATGTTYSEEHGTKAGLVFSSGEELMNEFLHGTIENKEENQDKEDNKEDKKEDKDKKSNSYDEEKKKQDEEPKKKKKLGKKGIIAIVASVCLVGVLLAIILPVVFYQAPRIFVKDASDFVASKKGGLNDYFYVLDKNVSTTNLNFDDKNIYSIDLHKHTLSVSDTFNITTDKSGTLYIGTRKGKGYVTNKKSNLKVGTLNIDAPKMDIVINANLNCEELTVNAKSFKLYNCNGGAANAIKANITAQKVVFAGNVKASSTSTITIESCKEAIVEKGIKISNTIALKNSKLTTKSKSSVSILKLDENSQAIISGTIGSKIEGIEEGVKGKQVIMKEGHSCPVYENIENLIIFRDNNSNHQMSGCENVIYVEKLATPVDIIIEERDNKIYCKFANVMYASKYEIVVKDGDKEVYHELITETEKEITNYVHNMGKSYNITITPIGNYNEEDIDLTASTLYTDGNSISVKYDYVITLAMPTKLAIENKDKKTFFSFNRVEYSDSYRVFIDGKEISGFKFDNGNDRVELDVTQYLKKVGNHSIRVQAISKNSNIKDSPISMISYSTTEKLPAVEDLNASINEDSDNNTSITVDWKGVQNGYEYKIELYTPDGVFEIGRTSILHSGKVTYSFNLKNIGYDRTTALSGGYKVIVTAIGHDYYIDSETATCTATLTQSPSEIGSENSRANNNGFFNSFIGDQNKAA